jgi:hypothetical protein
MLRQVELLIKNATEQNTFGNDSADDLLRLFCWQVGNNEKPSPAIVRYLASAFSKALADEIEVDETLGRKRKPGAPKSDPALQWHVAIWTKKLLLGCLDDEELLSNTLIPMDQKHLDDCRSRCKPKLGRKKISEAYAFKLMGLYCHYSSSTVRKLYEEVMQSAPPIDKSQSKEELAIFLGPHPPLVI